MSNAKDKKAIKKASFELAEFLYELYKNKQENDKIENGQDSYNEEPEDTN